MPRGNDPEAAREFQGQYGVHGNAEGLISEQRLRFPREVQSAVLKQFDRQATLDLDLSDVEAAAPHDNVLAAAVHGDRVVYVYEDDRGDYHKDVLAWDKRGGKVKSLKDEDRQDNEAEAKLREEHERTLEQKHKAAELGVEVREKVEKARADAEEAAAKKAARSASGGSGSGGSKS